MKKKIEKNRKKNGIIVRVQGPVVDRYFPGDLPNIHEALTFMLPNKKNRVLEVQFTIGDREVKTLAFG